MYPSIALALSCASAKPTENCFCMFVTDVSVVPVPAVVPLIKNSIFPSSYVTAI